MNDQIISASTFEIWVYRGVIGVLLIVVWWIIKLAFNRIVDVVTNINARFQQVDDKIETLSALITSSLTRCNLHEERVNNMLTNIAEHKVKLSDYGRRLTKTEFDVKSLKEKQEAIKEDKKTNHS